MIKLHVDPGAQFLQFEWKWSELLILLLYAITIKISLHQQSRNWKK